MRRRRRSESSDKRDGTAVQEQEPPQEATKEKSTRVGTSNKAESLSQARPQTQRLQYHVAKWLILRLLGLVYFTAFCGALFQNPGLMASRGLQPAEQYWRQLQALEPSPFRGFLAHPSLFWWIPLTDQNMQYLVTTGLVLSGAVVCGINSWGLQLFLWLLDFSVVTSAEATTFYSYGWESQLLETGFLAIFLCALPHWTTRQEGADDKKEGDYRRWKLRLALWESKSTTSEAATTPSPIVMWLFCWLIFRISLGAGLIKTRGSSCWADKTCLHYHFETQPLPSPLSFLYHFLPSTIQKRMVDTDLWVQLYTSWFVLLPTNLFVPDRGAASRFLSWTCRTIVRMGGFLQAGFMVGILLSGNFAFLNHLTIIPALACLDDDCWPTLLRRLATSPRPTPSKSGSTNEQPTTKAMQPRRLLDVALLTLVSSLSWPVVANLLQLDGGRQLMNASFGSFRLVNSYGAFGSVGTARYEAIVSVSDDGDQWYELEFPCKPGSVTRRPCFCAPYHYRLDWNIWFLGFPPHRMYLRRREGWLYNLLEKLLEEGGPGERPWLTLLDRTTIDHLAQNYYNHNKAPTYAKVDMYHYKMAASLWTIMFSSIRGQSPVWWTRQFKESLILPVALDADQSRLVMADLTVSQRLK